MLWLEDDDPKQTYAEADRELWILARAASADMRHELSCFLCSA